MQRPSHSSRHLDTLLSACLSDTLLSACLSDMCPRLRTLSEPFGVSRVQGGGAASHADELHPEILDSQPLWARNEALEDKYAQARWSLTHRGVIPTASESSQEDAIESLLRLFHEPKGSRSKKMGEEVEQNLRKSGVFGRCVEP